MKGIDEKTLGMSSNLINYIRDISVNEHPVLEELKIFNESHRRSRMPISPEQGNILQFLIKILGVKNYLEIGVFTGYSSLAAALALPEDGKLTALDISDEYTSDAVIFWEKAGVSNKIDLIIADAKESLSKLQRENRKFDFIFIDADKKNYISYYEASVELLAPNGVIAVDNMLWRGLVAEEDANDKITKTIKEFNLHVKNDPRTEICILPVTDGIMLIKKI